MGGASVLDGPGSLLSQDVGGMERPVGVAEEFAGEKDDVAWPVRMIWSA